MALLNTVASAALATGLVAAPACYSPELRDCTVSCESPADCGGNQVCGADRFCAAPELAGQCAGRAPIDAPVAPPDDAAPRDAAPADGMPLQRTLVVTIQDQGTVAVASVGTCDSAPPTMGHCTFLVAPGTVQLTATPHPPLKFDKWTTAACKDEGPTCSLVLTLPSTTVTAKFKH